MTEKAITIRRATAADVEVIVSHRLRMFTDMGLGDDAARQAAAGAEAGVPACQRRRAPAL